MGARRSAVHQHDRSCRRRASTRGAYGDGVGSTNCTLQSSTHSMSLHMWQLWYQGESDALSESDANSYKDRFAAWVLAAREALRAPTLPILSVAITGSTDKIPHLSAIRAAQLHHGLEGVHCFDADGAPNDGLHLDVKGNIQVGLGLASLYRTHCAKTEPVSEP
mmetsp:Transcript_49023/g.115183  ORF Transcript_49023/g.115183 Transcript_49023/m.115183 type:complete len:164 (-) Transcript_49023:1-492(-)